MPFPPYRLLDRDYVAEAQAKHERLERLYHVGQERSWDGRKVLGDLLKRHGGIHVREDLRQAIGQVFSLILWGELAAWSIAADLALMLEDVGAKMAATSQAHDEARHFYTMRDYLLEMGGEIPPLDGYSTVLLGELLDTPHLADKLLGMQLIVETTALTLFRAVARARVEPVLSDLMPYYERDEARHVGLGVLYLPTLLKGAGRVETLRLRLLQLKLLTMIGWGTHLRGPAFALLGIDAHDAMRHGTRVANEAFASMRDSPEGAPAAVVMGSSFMAGINDKAIEVFYPPPGQELPRWQRAMVQVCFRAARAGDAILRRAS